MIPPVNSNFQQATRFLLTFPRVSTTTYFCQSCNLPGLSISGIKTPTMFADIWHPSNKPNFEPFKATFIVNEGLSDWLELFYWINGLAPSINFEQYQNLKNLSRFSLGSKRPQYADGTLQILTALNNPIMYVDFTSMFPTDLTSVNFNTTETDTVTLIADITFRYDFFTIRLP